MEPRDILLNQNDDLIIKNGDFLIGNSEAQNLDHLCRANIGSLKHDPLTGIGIINLAKTRIDEPKFYTNTKVQLKADGWINESIIIDQQEIEINAIRNEIN